LRRTHFHDFQSYFFVQSTAAGISLAERMSGFAPFSFERNRQPCQGVSKICPDTGNILIPWPNLASEVQVAGPNYRVLPVFVFNWLVPYLCDRKYAVYFVMNLKGCVTTAISVFSKWQIIISGFSPEKCVPFHTF
jgi:hypothetical protein